MDGYFWKDSFFNRRKKVRIKRGPTVLGKWCPFKEFKQFCFMQMCIEAYVRHEKLLKLSFDVQKCHHDSQCLKVA